MRQHGLLRTLDTAELSDGTLRYLLLVAAAAERSQILVVTHAAALTEALRQAAPRLAEIALEKELGETVVRDAGLVSWTWPQR